MSLWLDVRILAGDGVAHARALVSEFGRLRIVPTPSEAEPPTTAGI